MANELGSPMNTQRTRTSCRGLKHGYNLWYSLNHFRYPVWYSNMASWEIPERRTNNGGLNQGNSIELNGMFQPATFGDAGRFRNVVHAMCWTHVSYCYGNSKLFRITMVKNNNSIHCYSHGTLDMLISWWTKQNLCTAAGPIMSPTDWDFCHRNIESASY